MIRTTFPDETIAWQREVERLIGTLLVGQRRLDQLNAPQSGGVVIGGNPPSPGQCLRFKFRVNSSASDCVGCVSACKTLHVASDIKATLTGDSSPSVVLAAGDYELTRRGAANDCVWGYGDIATGIYVHFDSPGESGGGHNTAVTLQHAHASGSLYYATTPESPSCDTIPYFDKDPAWEDHPSQLTLTNSDCSDPADTPDDCSSGIQIEAEVRWDAGRWQWYQSYFAINGDEGGGSISTTFNGATFSVDVTVAHFCFTGGATYHAPVYIDDMCRPVSARRATNSPAFPTTITGICGGCTEPSTSTSSTSSTTTDTSSTSTTSSSSTSSSTSTSSTSSTTDTSSTSTSSSSSSTTSTSSTTGTGSSSTTADPTIGQCCYGAPGSEFCTENTLAECMAIPTFINWTAGASCAGDPNPCRTGGSTSTTTSAGCTTLAPCPWVWDGGGWVLNGGNPDQTSFCSGDGCFCDFPDFDGVAPGDETTTTCVTA